ncbi:glycosyltransferase family 2 protein (plasmid) [Priestia megaterium]|uniref:glycosyltransferase family 2 protein n=1 Tax=Priestia megaterium TaxID=1404 RepID=UPI002ACD4EC0|nr:glycosyltransferase family 2 protein [Priestia megaterium]
MKDIHVFMFNYSNFTFLKKALTSLQFLDNRIQGITIFEETNLFLQIGKQLSRSDISYRNLPHNDLGFAFNKRIQELHSEYILLLHDDTFFEQSVKNVDLRLASNKFVMTHTYTFKAGLIPQPLLIKVAFLKQNELPTVYKVPFKEAILSSWLSKVSKSLVVNINEKIVNEGTKGVSKNDFQKLIFVEKYHINLTEKINPPTISVIISNYNMMEYVEIALTSCLLQINPPHEILVIDDGSTDHSYQQLEAYNNLHNFKLFQTENGGKARALNRLIPHIKTEFVLELDADDWLDPDALLVIGEYLSVLPQDVAVLYGNTRHWNQTELGNINCSLIKKGKEVKNKQELMSYKFPLAPRIYRTSFLKQNKGFPIVDFEDGRMYEDVSILNKLMGRYRLLYKDFTVYNVREHKSSITRKNKKNHSYWSDFKNKLD